MTVGSSNVLGVKTVVEAFLPLLLGHLNKLGLYDFR